MKSLFLALSVILTAQFSNAVYPPKPNMNVYRSTEIKVLKSTGFFGKKKNIQIQLTKSIHRLAHLSLIEESNPVPSNIEKYELVITQKNIKKVIDLRVTNRDSNCGSDVLTLVGKYEDKDITAILVDHQNRLCEDYRPYQIEFRAHAHKAIGTMTPAFVKAGELIFNANVDYFMYAM